MRKLVVLAAVLALPALSHARDTMDGCGLGWEVTSSETMIGTTTRGTTNAFVPPTFGMTTGTLGCKKLDIASNEKEAANYVVNNYPNLKQQLASGQGEYVQGLTEVMSCDVQKIQKQYDNVVAPARDGAELYKALRATCG